MKGQDEGYKLKNPPCLFRADCQDICRKQTGGTFDVILTGIRKGMLHEASAPKIPI